ncbi:antibiotic biosynthesis monooxygenase [Viridibacillus sp. FSL E2-0187]|uniref:Signal transduction protein TRAP n=1 Tax=Viridibacillus arvi TaxID=263475 RepID=A0A0M0LB30_9BACL|nr:MULTISPECIES: antibiotic biosynthesis monooxygenase [Viridibacillus]KOO47868.1 signal transduction protein TRAP [Viridibacillus arvi]QOV09277.1 antibiotic biosynthesis monooxygenase [Viridibacillus sp. JNUCC-6]
MNIYLTSGTPEFMESLRKKYSNEKMIVLHGSGNSMLLHETEGKSVFQTPRSYEVIDSINELEDKGFFVMNHLPVSDEGRPLFEHRFLSRSHVIESDPGFKAYRLLKPINSETYIVLTEWSGPTSFEAWKVSKAYKDAFENQVAAVGIENRNIFTSKAYVTTYTTAKNEETED